MKLTYKKFQAELRELVDVQLPGNASVEDALVIREAGQTVAPILYLDEFYDEYLDGSSLYQVCDHIMSNYHDTLENIPRDSKQIQLSDFSCVKDKIVPILVNPELNETLLAKAPHRTYKDLAVVYRIVVDVSGEGVASALVDTKMFAVWDIDEDKLFEIAVSNLDSILEFRPKLVEIGGPEAGMRLCAITNKCGTWGANAVLNNAFMQELSEVVGDDLILLPSSTHEMLAVPREEDASIDMYKSTVKEVNCTVVAPKDVLSYSVYQYRDHTFDLAEPSMPDMAKTEEGRRAAAAPAREAAISKEK